MFSKYILAMMCLVHIKSAHDITVDTFNDIVKHDQNNFLMLYAPWCGHCKTTKPIFKTFEHPNTIVGMIDW